MPYNPNLKLLLAKGFTLVEILTAIIILSILVSLTIASYQKTLQANDDRICQQNLKILEASIDVYALENDAIPSGLSKLSPRHIHLAKAKVLGCRADNLLLAFWNRLKPIRTAYAGDLTQKYYADPKVLHCPADKTNQNGISYSINSSLTIADLTSHSTKSILYDSSTWHKEGVLYPTYHANGITTDGIAGEIQSSDTRHIIPTSELSNSLIVREAVELDLDGNGSVDDNTGSSSLVITAITGGSPNQ